MSIKVPAGLCKGCLAKLQGKGRWCDRCRPISKYRSQKVDGFDSKKECSRHAMLQLLQHGGAIRNLQTQVPYHLAVNGIHICKYVADFVYEELANKKWQLVVEDTKGVRTTYYKVKVKLMRACHGITIREV